MNPNPPTDTTEASDQSSPNRRIDQIVEEVAQLAAADMPPGAFFQEFLMRVLAGIEAQAGAVWIRNPQGFLQLQYQSQIDSVGLDNHKNGRQSHNELLRQAIQTAKPILLEPYGSTGILEGIPAGNPTDFVVLLVPILLDEKTALGLVEVWEEPRWDARTKRAHLNYLVQMAAYASGYVRNQQSRQMLNQEQLWSQLESFSCQIHSTLDITTVSYHIANEGRRLVGSDRISVAVREGKKARIEAVSGADVVEKRSAQIKLMRKLCQAVLQWDEKLVFRGVKDDGLPPDVYEALDKYLAESAAKLLVCQPLRDQREKDPQTKEYKPGKARSALLMECYEPPAQPEPIIARLDVVGRHAASALYNSTEMRNIPLRFLWKPIMAVQEGLGGKTRFITFLISTAVIVLLLAMVLVPWELKMDAKGQLVPENRLWIYAPREGKIEQFDVEPNSVVSRNQVLIEMFDPLLQKDLGDLNGKIETASQRIRIRRAQLQGLNLDQASRDKLTTELSESEAALAQAEFQLNVLNKLYPKGGRLGAFQVMAPQNLANRQVTPGEPDWLVLSGSDIRDLKGKYVKPSDPILRIGQVSGQWEIELKIPQKHIGQVLAAFKTKDPDEKLDVDLKLENQVTKTYRGKLARRDVTQEAVPNKDEHSESDPVVYAYVRVSGDDIPEEDRIPIGNQLAGVEVKAKIRCGPHAMGYSLFYGVWEYLCEKIFYLF
ncbi:MAG TPA: hypothetical protein VKS79_15740 [Gemmataceae bacterium]|nr:hypothetical protein [Gemmataceae bacterium]